MIRHRVRAALLLLMVLSFSLICYAQPTPDDSFIKVEVVGTLNFRHGNGYYVATKSKRFPNSETLVWLNMTEDKILVRKLQRMMGKRVSILGELEQLPENVNASTPPHGIFVRLGFKIEEIKDL